ILLSNMEIPPDTLVKRIAIGVINKRIFDFRIPFVEQHAIIAEIPQGYITIHYERNKGYPITNRLNPQDLCNWEHMEFQSPKSGTTVENLISEKIGKLWIFPDLRYVDEILPSLFERQ